MIVTIVLGILSHTRERYNINVSLPMNIFRLLSHDKLQLIFINLLIVSICLIEFTKLIKNIFYLLDLMSNTKCLIKNTSAIFLYRHYHNVIIVIYLFISPLPQHIIFITQ